MSPSLVPQTDVDGSLSAEQLSFWHENGYLIIENALDGATLSNLLRETDDLLNGFSLSDHPMTRFSTGEGNQEHIGDDYFLTSGDKVRFFFEEDAFDSNGCLTKPKHRAVNKIGHYLHGSLLSFRDVSLSKRNARIARSLRFRDPRVLQSMVICKQPEIGGRVPLHQDSTFLYTNPPSAVGFWYALEDATTHNGCLSFAKGSHKRAPINERFVRVEGGHGTGFEEVKTARYPEDMEPELDAEAGDETYTIAEVKAGTLVLIHGNILHKSEKNLSGKSRVIYTFHMIEQQGPVYDEKNWLQPPVEGFSKLPPV